MKARETDLSTSIGLLALRLGAGGFMMSHGWGKFQKVLAGNFDQFADPLGLGTGISLVSAAGAEFGCALLVILGLGTRAAAVPIVFTMAVAALVIHGGDPLSMTEGARLFKEGLSPSWASKEPALLFLIPFLALMFTGAGKLSLDALLFHRNASETTA